MTPTRTSHRLVAALTAGLLLAMLTPAPPAAAVEPPLDVVPQQVFSTDAQVLQGFGVNAAIWGDTAMVAVNENSGWGSVDVFTRHGGHWHFRETLVPDQYTGQDAFGYAIAISGKTALIGALGYDENRGAVIQSYRAAEVVIRPAVCRRERVPLRPRASAAGEHVRRALALIDVRCADQCRVSVERQRRAERGHG